MQALLRNYAAKLAAAGLCEPDGAVFAALDDTLVTNRTAEVSGPMAEIMALTGASALLFTPPAEPYRTIVDFLARRADTAIVPSDCETRTFQHDLPVVRNFDPGAIAAALTRRKSVIVPGRGVLTHGSISPEQAFVSACSVLFACFVKFFNDYLPLHRHGTADRDYRLAMERAARLLPPKRTDLPRLLPGPFTNRAQAEAAMIQVGKATVDYALVDSSFGNVSALVDGVLHISQTGSSLDELADCIDPCPLDGSTCAGLTASSEFVAHRGIVERAGARTILHGHPRFAVILSMDCQEPNCPHRGRCHLDCDRPRFLGDIPVVPGEVGTGPKGLATTLPPAMEGRRGAIVYGHGLFAVGERDFNAPFATLLEVENFCRDEYFRRIAE
ncbi:class II aldolase/adducin family protein [Fundidesulfovibrio butyratiphilus]